MGHLIPAGTGMTRFEGDSDRFRPRAKRSPKPKRRPATDGEDRQCFRWSGWSLRGRTEVQEGRRFRAGLPGLDSPLAAP